MGSESGSEKKRKFYEQLIEKSMLSDGSEGPNVL